MVGGITFDSKKEATRWSELVQLQRDGKISGLIRQKRFRLVVNTHLICIYVADYVYWENGLRVVEDCKSPVTSKLPIYCLKRKLMAAVFGITIRES